MQRKASETFLSGARDRQGVGKSNVEFTLGKQFQESPRDRVTETPERRRRGNPAGPRGPMRAPVRRLGSPPWPRPARSPRPRPGPGPRAPPAGAPGAALAEPPPLPRSGAAAAAASMPRRCFLTRWGGATSRGTRNPSPPRSPPRDPHPEVSSPTSRTFKVCWKLYAARPAPPRPRKHPRLSPAAHGVLTMGFVEQTR